jgi:hypothetical protein
MEIRTAERFQSIIEWCNDANDSARMPDDIGARAIRYSVIMMHIRNVAISGLKGLENAND